AQAGVVDHHTSVAWGPLHRQRPQRTAGEHSALIEDRCDIHQPASPEESLLGGDVGVPAWAVHIDQSILLNTSSSLCDHVGERPHSPLDYLPEHIGNV